MQAPTEVPTVEVEGEAESEGVAERLWALGATGVEERDASTLLKGRGVRGSGPAASASRLWVGYFDHPDVASVAAEVLCQAGLAARRVMIAGDDWKHAWKAFFKPVRIGQGLWVRPSWERIDVAPGDVVITLDPGQAFGTGTHETTRLCLREVERLTEARMRVLDMGCGSGILALAALRLGAGSAVAVDTDELAVRASLDNAKLNGVEARLSAALAPPPGEHAFDLVLANIRAPVLIPMAAALGAHLAPGGALLLSGILAEEREAVEAAYRDLELERTSSDGDWVALTYRGRDADRP